MGTERLGLLRQGLCCTSSLCCVLVYAVMLSSQIQSEERLGTNESQKGPEIPFPNWTRGDVIEVQHLQSWIQEYKRLGDDFGKRNALAFRFSNYNDLWCSKLSYMAFNSSADEESRMAISHLTSAYYTGLNGPREVYDCLREKEPCVVAGQLIVLRSAQQLRPNGSDRDWPTANPLDPQRLPKHIAAVLDQHPRLAVDVAQTLEVYGPLALKETSKLLPLLLSEDDAVVSAAQSAIRHIDAEGLAKIFHLEGRSLTLDQRTWIREYLRQPPVADSRESDGTAQSVATQRYEELHRYLRLCRHGRSDLVWDDASVQANRELADLFRDHSLPEDWWRILSAAYFEPEFNEPSCDRLIPMFASALYTNTRSQAEVIKVLQDEDPRIVAAAMCLICQMRQITSDAEFNTEEYLVDPKVMPSQFVNVLERHPHLHVSVALCLRNYGSHASSQVHALVPFLLSDDPYVVEAMRGCITDIDPSLSRQLDITLEGYVPFKEHLRKMKLLTPRQRELILAHLARCENAAHGP